MTAEETGEEWLKLKEQEGETVLNQGIKVGINSKRTPLLKQIDKTIVKKETTTLQGVGLKQATLEQILKKQSLSKKQ
jgi:hypothetical protein